MKPLYATILMLCCFAGSARLCANPQEKYLNDQYAAQGDALFVPLYWLPETRKTVLKYISDHEEWVGFEMGRWKEIEETTKKALLKELSSELTRFEAEKRNATWKRVRDWQSISTQLALLSSFLDDDDSGFLDLAFSDPTLRPAFDWIINRRPEGFDTKHIGATLTSGEVTSFNAHLVKHLLDTPERMRFECFSRLFARIAVMKPIKE